MGEIVRKARGSNSTLNITGLLIFDGLHFCEQIEGHEEDVLNLLARILRDPRHVGIRVLVNGASQKRQFSGFALGYVTGGDVDVLVGLGQLRGKAASDAFWALLPGIDMGG